MRFCLVFLASLSSLAMAKDFANCSLANEQLKVLNDYLEPQIRIRASQAIIEDIEALRPHMIKNETGLPDKLIRLCFDIKRKAFQATFIKGGAALFGNYDFLLASGKYFFYERVWATSHEAFEAAAKLRPNYFEPNYLALQAWIYTQLSATKPVSVAAYQQRVKFYVDNMLKSKDVKPEDKRLILSFLANAEKKSSKLYTARAMVQRSINMNPNDMKARFQLGELEEQAGRLNEAKRAYEAALAATMKDPATEKQIYDRLARLYSLFGDRAKLKNLVADATKKYPSDPYFKSLSSDRQPASTKK